MYLIYLIFLYSTLNLSMILLFFLQIFVYFTAAYSTVVLILYFGVNFDSILWNVPIFGYIWGTFVNLKQSYVKWTNSNQYMQIPFLTVSLWSHSHMACYHVILQIDKLDSLITYMWYDFIIFHYVLVPF